LNHCQLCEQPIEDGYLCRGCVKATVVRLECLPQLYAGLAPFLTPAVSGGRGRGSRPVYAPLPVSEDILDLRGPGGMVGAVEGWVAAIRKDRRFVTTPTRRPGVGPSIEVRLNAAVAELIANMPWVSVSWPDAGAFAIDIRELTRSVSSIVDPQQLVDQGTRLGNCPAAFEDGVLCGAVLRLYPGDKAVTCRWCGVSYPPAAWPGLKLLIDEDEKGAQIVGTPGGMEESCRSAS